MCCFSSASFLIPRSEDERIYGKQHELVQKPRPSRNHGGGSRHLIGAATCLSALIPDAVAGRGTAVGGRSGENYKVISLRFGSSPAGMELGMLSAFATMNG